VEEQEDHMNMEKQADECTNAKKLEDKRKRQKRVQMKESGKDKRTHVQE
jgi:hypothetical protein